MDIKVVLENKRERGREGRKVKHREQQKEESEGRRERGTFDTRKLI